MAEAVRGRRVESVGTVAEVGRVTQQEKPAGIGKDAVARIWRDHGLKPWKVETFKISNDPASRRSASMSSPCT